jgi:hypothetical protein
MDMSGQFNTAAALPPRYLLDRRLVGPQTRPGCYGEEIIIIIYYSYVRFNIRIFS